jgi:NADH-quinone oxidoreductase subunit J
MQSNAPFLLVALITLTAAAAAMRLRNLVHCALCAALAFGGLAIAYLLLNAEFIALAQLLIYVGAVAILIVFGIMLTRGAEICGDAAICGPRPWMGLTVAALLCAILICAALEVPPSPALAPLNGAASVRQIGREMMSGYIVPLEAVGLLLTAALIGAVVIAVREGMPPKRPPELAEPVVAVPPPLPPLELQPLDRR